MVKLHDNNFLSGQCYYVNKAITASSVIPCFCLYICLHESISMGGIIQSFPRLTAANNAAEVANLLICIGIYVFAGRHKVLIKCSFLHMRWCHPRHNTMISYLQRTWLFGKRGKVITTYFTEGIFFMLLDYSRISSRLRNQSLRPAAAIGIEPVTMQLHQRHFFPKYTKSWNTDHMRGLYVINQAAVH